MYNSTQNNLVTVYKGNPKNTTILLKVDMRDNSLVNDEPKLQKELEEIV